LLTHDVHLVPLKQDAQKLGHGAHVLFKLYVPVVQVIAAVQRPLTRVCPAAHPHLPALNVNEGAQAIQDPVPTVHDVQFPGHGLQTLLLKNSVDEHGEHQPVEF
jgi:hypothetical protein